MQQYKEKETRLNKAIDTVKNKLQSFSNEAAKIKGNWSEADREYFKAWNNWHDLQYRLENRLWDNWSNYKDWHYETFQFNTYP